MLQKITFLIFTVFFISTSCTKDNTILELHEEPVSVNTPPITKDVFELVNKHRENLGKPALVRNTIADSLGIDHTNYMIAHQKVSHANFKDRLLKLQQRVQAKFAIENVATGYPTAESAMKAWLENPKHKTNIEGNYTHIGIAAIKDSKNKYYFTQLFYR